MHEVALAHAAATWAMVGLIWFVQIVHYPLFGQVGGSELARYASRHAHLTSFVVGPVMIIETTTAVALLVDDPTFVTGLGVALVGVIWLSTAVFQVPCHKRLALGFDAEVHGRLVATNWIRTVAWAARGVIALALVQS